MARNLRVLIFFFPFRSVREAFPFYLFGSPSRVFWIVSPQARRWSGAPRDRLARAVRYGDTVAEVVIDVEDVCVDDFAQDMVGDTGAAIAAPVHDSISIGVHSIVRISSAPCGR